MRSFAALALALALAVGGASAQLEGMPGGFEECPHPHSDNDIDIVVANTYNSQGQKPKCGTHNGPVDPNTLDTQNIVECHQQIVAGAAAAPSRHRCCQLYPRSLSAVFL